MNLVQQVLGLSDELVQPRRHVERRHYWDRNRNRKKLPEHVTLQPGLLAQLHASAVAPNRLVDESGSCGKPKSRPPLAIEAFSRWLEISSQARDWCFRLGIHPRGIAEDNIRALDELAPRLDADSLEALIQDLKTWRRWAAVMTGWETKLFIPNIECPTCHSFRSIRVNAEIACGYCSECQHYWEGSEQIVYLARQRGVLAA